MAKKKSEKNKKRISLCMIVKDEEKFLPQCLDSVKDHVDEIVVVDTGSTDRTIEIAESYGASVYHHPWENNFSKHRNQSISYATGDWILIMDADEELDPETVSLVRKAVNEAPTAVIAFNVRSYQENGIYHTETGSPRLFKNGLGFHYRGYVHNQLIIQDKITPYPIVLWHYGYDLSPDQMKAKQQKSLKLLMKQIQEFPDDLVTRHHLAMTLLACGEYDEAYREAKLTIEKMDVGGVEDNSFSWTYFVETEALIKLERFDEAESVCLKGLNTFDWSIDLHHCLARIKFMKKEYHKVLEHGNMFLRLREDLQNDIFRVASFNFETVHRDWVILRVMGYAHLYQGQHDEGIDLLEKALRRTPGCDHDTLAEEIGLNLTRLKKMEKAISFLEKLPKGERKFEKGLMVLGANYEFMGRLEEAATLYGELETFFEEKEEIPFKRGLLLLKLGRHGEAASAFEAAVKRRPDYIDAFINWGLALENQGEMKEAEAKYLSALKLEPDSPMGNLNLGLFYFKDKGYMKSIDYLLKASSHFPENIYLHLALARGYVETGEIEVMVGVCENTLNLLDLPAQKKLESIKDLGLFYYVISKELLKRKDFASYEIAYQIGHLLAHDDPTPLLELSEEAFLMGEPEAGKKVLDYVYAEYPSLLHANRNKGA